MKKVRYAIEAIILVLFYGLCDLLPVTVASNIGGWIGRTIGPRLAASRKAQVNMRESLPELNDTDIEKHISTMWDNLGRVVAEYPHLADISQNRVRLQGTDIIKSAIDRNRPVILFGAHLANWEVMAPAVYNQLGIKLGLVYRALNNPVSEKLLDYARNMQGQLETIPKSKTGTRRLVQSLKAGQSIGILIDQKYNEGIPVSFFGRPAMTSSAFVQLARKYNADLIPLRCVREKDCRFTITFEEPLDINGTDLAVVRKANERLESWITARPGEWMWLHRRWGKVEG